MLKTKMKEYIDNNKSAYVGQYRLYSCVKTNAYEYKFRYYTRDPQFRELSVFLTVDYSNGTLSHSFSVSLNEEEKKYMLKDAYETICLFEEHQSILHSHILEVYIRNKKVNQFLEPQDYRNILDYLEYHKGMGSEVIDEFYDFFMPYLEHLHSQKSYSKLISSIELLLDRIIYEYEWDGVSSKYLDRQYPCHMPYIYKILGMIVSDLDIMCEKHAYEMIDLLYRILGCERFALLLVTHFSFEEKVERKYLNNLGPALESYPNQDSLVVRYLLSMYRQEDNQDISFDILRTVMEDILTFDNNQVEKTIGSKIIENKGYNFIIRLFTRDYNTFVFVCWPIATFPEKYHTIIRLELETAIRYYAARMQHDRHRLTSFEQVSNINRLLMENYKEYYENGKE